MDSKINPSQARPRVLAEAEALFESIGDGAFATDANAHISRINQTALSLLGYKREELIGKWFPEMIPVEDEHGKSLSSIERPIGQIFLLGKPVSARAYYRRKNGSRLPVFMTVSPIMLRGKPVGAIEVFRDISDEIALERAKDEFVAIASHQLRTPATAVKQYLGLLLEGYSEPLAKGQRLFLEKAYESNERQLQIVQEILNVSQLDLEKVVLRPSKVDVRELVEAAVTGLRGSFETKNQDVVVDLPVKPLIINIDGRQIRLALENLLENASNYTWRGKAITVTCRRAAGGVKICVEDQGVGIDSADYSKLFQKFSRIDNPLSMEISGTGLGLYWAARIVELHGGSIQVRSKIGRGTRFTINLPAGL